VYVKPDAGNKPETGNQMAELKKYSSAAAIILQRTAVLRFRPILFSTLLIASYAD